MAMVTLALRYYYLIRMGVMLQLRSYQVLAPSRCPNDPLIISLCRFSSFISIRLTSRLLDNYAPLRL